MGEAPLTPHDRVLGCLLGGAAGDALGAPVEFWDAERIFRTYGPGGIRDYPAAAGGTITDDTQMTIATARGLLAAGKEALAREPAGGDVIVAVYREYLGWLRTQDDPTQRRGPGTTCLTALGSGRMGTVGRAINDSKGCGGVMRVAPVGLALPGQPEAACALGCATAAITHGHPGGQTPSGWLAALVARLAAGERLADAVLDMRQAAGLDCESAALVGAASDLAGAGDAVTPAQAWRRLGAGWTGDEALAIGIYSALRHSSDFEAAVVTAVNHSGDSDSTGLICGVILGTALGAAAVPARWLEDLERRDELMGLAADLVATFW